MPAEPLDICLVVHNWPPHGYGGVENHSSTLARELRGRGHRVRVLAMDGRPGQEPFEVRDEDYDGFPIRRVAYAYQNLGALADLVRHPQADALARDWLQAGPCDVVHVQHLTGWGMSLLDVVRGLNLPLVMSLHDYWPLCPRGQMLRIDNTVCVDVIPERCSPCISKTWPHLLPSQGARCEGPSGKPLVDDDAASKDRTDYAVACLEKAHRLISPSARTREIYVRNGVSASRVEVIENGLAVRELAESVLEERASVSRDDGQVHFGILGASQPSKGGLEFAQIFASLDLPNAHLHIHGSLPPYHGDDSYVRDLQEFAESQDRVHVHGPFPSLPKVLASLDVLVAPARWEEVFGLIAYEARAAGLWVLVSDRGGLPGAVEDGVTGRIVPAEDVDAWKAAIQEFVSSPRRLDDPVGATERFRKVADMAVDTEAVFRAAIAAARS